MLALCVFTAPLPLEVSAERGAARSWCGCALNKQQQRAVVEPFLLASVSSWKALLISSH